jgi:manganese transport protein
VAITLVGGLLCVFAVKDTFSALIISQMLLSIQLPITVCLQIYLTSSKKVMGAYANSRFDIISLWLIAGIIVVLNIMLLVSALH